MSNDPLNVRAINKTSRKAVLDNGVLLDIAVMLDCDGDETDDPAEGVVGVCELPSGKWITLDFRDYETGTFH